MKKVEPLERLRALAKSKGEGSRGGHVVGHTRSGKAIYDHHRGGGGLMVHPNHARLKEAKHVPYSSSKIGGFDEPFHLTPRKTTQLVIPLKNGGSAHHTITEVFQDQDMSDRPRNYASGTWTVHDPNGALTHHQVHPSFIQHPTIKALAQEHLDETVEHYEPQTHTEIMRQWTR